jgi:L-ascorbate metabolism protein UlaG (beta-lactamase superfamily)
LSTGSGDLFTSPCAYTPNSAELIATATAVLVTRDHPDHFDAGILNAALDAQPDLQVCAPASVVQALETPDDRVTAAKTGDEVTVVS